MRYFYFILINILIQGLNSTKVSAQSKQNYQEIESTINLVASAINEKRPELIDSAFAKQSALFYGTVNGFALEPFTEDTHMAKGLYKFITYWRDNNINVTQKFSLIKVKIEDNGTAIVKTKYSAFKDDRVTHWGNEYYSLVNTSNGWKIVSCVFTVNAPS